LNASVVGCPFARYIDERKEFLLVKWCGIFGLK